MKRFLSVFLALCMLISTLAIVPMSASAVVVENGDKIYSSFSYPFKTTEINGIQYIVVTPTLQDNTGFASLEMKLHFDTAKLTVVTANVPTDYPNPIGKFQTGTDRLTGEPTYTSGMSVFNIDEAGIDLSKVSFVKFVAVTGTQESKENGDLFDAYFTVKEGYKPEDIKGNDFSLEVETFADINGKDKAFKYLIPNLPWQEAPIQTVEPTIAPTVEPTVEPTQVPTIEPTAEPTIEPETVAPYTFPFVDVADNAWYRGDVEGAHKNGLINGKSATEYMPNDNMTYAEAVKLACALNQLYYDGKVTLTNGEDVWYSTYMDYAKEKGIIENDLTDVANEKVTRRDFVKIFYKAIPEVEYKAINDVVDDKIPDVKMADDGAQEIYTFYRAGILTGSDEAGTFYGESNITRAEVAAILTRMFDRNARKTITLN